MVHKMNTQIKQREQSRPTVSTSMRNFITSDTNLLRLLIITLFVFITMSLLNTSRFFTIQNLTSMSFQFPELGLFALAIMLSLITEGIDLSVVSIANLSGILAALILTKAIPQNASDLSGILWIALAVLTALTTGLLGGLLNGLLITRAGITPILTTLGTMQLYMGLAFVITKGPAVYGYPESFLMLGNSMIWIFPIPLLLFIIIALALGLVLKWTRFGFNLYMLGTNEAAARFSGMRINVMMIKTYMLSGFLSALAGLIMIARTNSAKADYGSSYLLQAVLVAILGGVNPSGGFGTVSGVVIAVLALQFLSSGFNMLRFSNFTTEFTWGILLLVVMVINFVTNRKQNR